MKQVINFISKIVLKLLFFDKIRPLICFLTKKITSYAYKKRDLFLIFASNKHKLIAKAVRSFSKRQILHKENISKKQKIAKKFYFCGAKERLAFGYLKKWVNFVLIN
ncbi:MAG: hypothetical protein ACK4TA_17810 [Saprospiraceae bacterium]